MKHQPAFPEPPQWHLEGKKAICLYLFFAIIFFFFFLIQEKFFYLNILCLPSVLITGVVSREERGFQRKPSF